MLLKSLLFSSKGKFNKLRVFQIATLSSEKDILGWGGRGEAKGRSGVSGPRGKRSWHFHTPEEPPDHIK